VLGPDVVVLERSRFLLRENDDLAGPFCKSLEHVLLVLPAVRVEASASVDAGPWTTVVGRDIARLPTSSVITAERMSRSVVAGRP
jgi:hypothetical protein